MKELCQFYTRNAQYIVGDLLHFIPQGVVVVDPFAGKGDLTKMLPKHKIDRYDISPKVKSTIKRDTLLNPPNYTGKWVLTNPPFLAKNKAKNKATFDKYGLDDLYKIAIKTIIGCAGGIIIVPINLFSTADDNIRKEFLHHYRILKLKVFEEQVFKDTSYSVSAFAFKAEPNHKQIVPTQFLPSKDTLQLELKLSSNYSIAPDFFDLIEDPDPLPIKRLLTTRPDIKPNSFLYFRATDTGSSDGRIGLSINKNFFYGKLSTRTFATLVLPLRYGVLNETIQLKICHSFNKFVEEFRSKYHSLFLTNYMDASARYARKRMSFEMAYQILSYILKTQFNYL